MARKKKSEEGAIDLSEDPALFPELGNTEKEKELARALRRFDSDKSEHAEAQKTLKKKMDESMRRAVILLHELGLEKVRVNGRIYETRPGDEKIVVSKVKEPKASDTAND